jgi:hypothetical protein
MQPNSTGRAGLSAHRCLHCDYIIDNLSENRCPECGRTFDLRDARTHYVGGPLSHVSRRLLKPPGLFLHGATIAAALAVMEPRSRVQLEDSLGWTGVVAPIILATWLLRLGLRIAIGVRRHMPVFRPRLCTLRWLVLPAALAASWLLADTAFPFRLRVYLSRPAMDHLAKACLALPPDAALPQPAWVGLFPAVGMHRIDGGISFLIPNSGFCCAVEFAYSPDRTPTGIHEFTHVSGNWYMTHCQWLDQ